MKRIQNAVKKLIIQEHDRFQRCWSRRCYVALFTWRPEVQLPDLVVREAKFRNRFLTCGTSSFDPNLEFAAAASADQAATSSAAKGIFCANLKYARAVCCSTFDYEQGSFVAIVGDNSAFWGAIDKHY